MCFVVLGTFKYLNIQLKFMELRGTITPGMYDRIKAPSLVRAQFDQEKRITIDESVAFWERALNYVLSLEYSPKTYNLRFGDVRFAWCRRMELIDNTCDDCDFFDGEWCGHAPFVNKLQPEISDCLDGDSDLNDVSFALMPKNKLADNIEAFIEELNSFR
jgi:hypothetical protein